ncbi:hypothetical protein [Streptomyces sp. HUAS TT3]|uniref:hypothetical protein n=1 Tax=Streptomyces sp. HUAS TT3 TaxID=3447510 RepID=UPI003F6554FF
MDGEVGDDVEALAGRDVESVESLGCGQQPPSLPIYEPPVPAGFDVEPKPVAAGVGAVQQTEAIAAARDLQLGPGCAVGELDVALDTVRTSALAECQASGSGSPVA